MNTIWIVMPVLIILMFLLGLDLNKKAFVDIAENPKAVLLGMIGQIVVLPLVAFALAWILDLPPVYFMGLVLIACCPGRTSSNVFSMLAKGDVALSVTLTALSSILTLFTLPVTFIMLGLAALTGCSLLFYGGWWLLPVGLCIMMAALAYSAGPYPLSHHGLGDIAVVIFFGVVPVTLTYWLQVGQWNDVSTVLGVSLAVGLMAANVLIVNNYRDMNDDKVVGKNTTVVLFGRKVIGTVYLMSGILAMALMIPLWMKLPVWALLLPAFYLLMHVSTWRMVITSSGSALNPLLGKTARNLLLFSLLLLVVLIVDTLSQCSDSSIYFY